MIDTFITSFWIDSQRERERKNQRKEETHEHQRTKVKMIRSDKCPFQLFDFWLVIISMFNRSCFAISSLFLFQALNSILIFLGFFQPLLVLLPGRIGFSIFSARFGVLHDNPLPNFIYIYAPVCKINYFYFSETWYFGIPISCFPEYCDSFMNFSLITGWVVRILRFCW